MTENEQNVNLYKVELVSSNVEKQLNKIPDKDYTNIRTKILELRNNPRSIHTVKLYSNLYRIRVGNYRIIYEIYDKEHIIAIHKIDRRKERTYKM